MTALALLLTALLAGPARAAGPVLPHAFSHNDYDRPRPLFDALDEGFVAVEADLHLVKGQLLVAHELADAKPEKNLVDLYLEPLLERVRAQGAVHPGGPGFILLLDIKSKGDSTYLTLRAFLAGYGEMFTKFHKDGRIEPGPVTVLISGNKAPDVMEAERVRYAALDGGFADLDSGAPSAQMPLISDDWRFLSKWRGVGPIDPKELDEMRMVVRLAHEKGRKVRFYGAPDDERVWDFFLKEGVDLLSTDDPARLGRFLRARGALHTRAAAPAVLPSPF